MLWLRGRKNIWQNLEKSLAAKHQRTIWMHCASLGEFEQGRPVINKLKEKYPSCRFVISFFSPSGYEIAKKKNEFEHLFYLPADSKDHAKKWLDIVKPDLVLWVKYEYWHYYLAEIKKSGIPLLMVSAIYLRNQPFFKWYGNFYRKMLEAFTHFFVQNRESKNRLKLLVPVEKITVSGDTRCDRVINIAENFTDIPGIAEFCGGKKVVVMGSTWEDDEVEWTHFVRTHPQIKFIIAPHEIDEENLQDVQKEFPGSVFYSEWRNHLVENMKDGLYNCMIIDNIGILSRLYRYATIAYVGGGFGDDGLHNILEATVYAKPVIFGPHFEKNFEAEEMINCGAAFTIGNALELEKIMEELLTNDEKLISSGTAAKKYIYKNAGATEKIISFIENNNLI